MVKPVAQTVVKPVVKAAVVQPVAQTVVKPVVKAATPVVQPAQTVVKPVVKAAAPVVQPVVKAAAAVTWSRPQHRGAEARAPPAPGRRARPGAVP